MVVCFGLSRYRARSLWVKAGESGGEIAYAECPAEHLQVDPDTDNARAGLHNLYATERTARVRAIHEWRAIPE